MRRALMLMVALTLVVGLVAGAHAQAILRIGMQDEPKTLNPLKATDVWSWNVLDGFYESLYRYSPQVFDVIPSLAEGDPVISADGLEAVVRLKRGVTWHDGQPFTADDVVFTVNDLMIKWQIPRYLSRYEFVERAEKVDDHTVRFRLKESRATFVHGTLQQIIVPKHQWAPIEAEASRVAAAVQVQQGEDAAAARLAAGQKHLLEYDLRDPVGTGPFIFHEWRLGSFVSVRRNPTWHLKGLQVTVDGGPATVGPHIDGILYKIYRSVDAAVLALQRDEVDYNWWPVLPGQVPQLLRARGVTVTDNAENGMFYLAYNLKRPPFDDVKLRQALAVLVDKEFIVSRVLQNYGTPLYTVVPPGNAFWFNADTRRWGEGLDKEERLAQAKELLSGAGYRWDDAGNLILPNGQRMQAFEILTPPADYDPFRAMAGLLVQEWWRELGVPATARPASFGTIVTRVFEDWNFDVYILGWRLTIYPDYIRDFFHSSQYVFDGNNPMGYVNPEFDALADSFVRELDQEKARAIAFRVQEMLAEELPYVVLYARNSIEAYRSDRFTGWVNQLEGIGNWWSIPLIRPVR